MKSFQIIVLLIFVGSGLFGQNGKISGRVVHSDSGEIIPYATIVLENNSEKDAQRGMVTNDKGVFEYKKIPFGSYKLSVRFIGFKNYSKEVELTKSRAFVNLGDIKIEPSELKLDEVEVKANAQTSTTSLDRKTYRVADFATAKGGNAADVLNKLPSVSVDPDGTVSLRGTSDFMVYLNGKPTQLDPSMLLSQISAEMIEKIEVITVPTARYDAQGKGGIINITTKKSTRDGLSVSLNGLAGGAPWGERIDPFTEFVNNDDRYNAGASISYAKDKLSLYGGFNYNYLNINGRRTGDARLLQSDGSYYHMIATGERPEWFRTNSFNAGVAYDLTKRITISADVFSGKRTEGRSAFYTYNNFFADIDKNEIPGVAKNEAWIFNPNTDNRYGNFTSGVLDFQYSINETDELSLSILTEKSGLSRELVNQDLTYYPGSGITGELERHFLQKDDTPLNVYRFSAEYLKGLGENHSIRVGLQPQIFSIDGSFSYDVLNTSTNDWDSNNSLENGIDLSRNIYAGFVDYQGAYKNFDWAAGLRAEYTDQFMTVKNPDYFSIFERESKSEFAVQKLDLFPNLHVQYNAGKAGRLLFAASRRISRPPIKNMAPFLYRRHYEVYVVGDPDLMPEYLTNLELNYIIGVGKHNFNLTGFYRGTDNAIFRVNTVYEEENVLIRSYTNSGNTQSTGAELNANIEIGPQAKLFLGGSMYNYHINADIFGYQEDNSSLNWSLKSSLNIFPIPQIRISGDIDIRSATVTAQGRNEMFYMANAIVEYTPKRIKGWTISVKGIDLLGSNQKGLSTRAFNEEGVQIFYQQTEYLRFGPILEVQVNYNLNWKSKKTSAGEFGNKEF